jgi:Flp pilus assembly protein CpaB
MRSKLPLVAAILIGIGAVWATHTYVKKQQQQITAQLKGSPVLAAAADIPAGTELTREMLKPMEVPDQFIPSQAISLSRDQREVRQLLGRKTRVKIRRDQMILWSDLVSEMPGGLATIIPRGEGAFSLTINTGIKPTLIQPGDHIDIIGSFALPKTSQPLPAVATAASWRPVSDIVNVVLLQNVTVLAVGETLAGQPRGGGGTDLTLSLTLREAQLLMFASDHGSLGAVLRREGANEFMERSELVPITFQDIQKIADDLDNQRKTRIIEIQKGPNTINVPVMNSP